MRALTVALAIAVALSLSAMAYALASYKEPACHVPVHRAFGAVVSDKLQPGEWHE